MSKKLTILVLIGLGIAAFGGSFGLSRWLTVPKPPPDDEGTGKKVEAVAEAEGGEALLQERHLYDLIREVRAKLRDCEKRQARLVQEETRLNLAKADLQKEAEALETLRVQVASTVADLKKVRAQLEASRVQIRQNEQANLKKTAAIYDRMTADAAAPIFESMCQNAQNADVVKIFRFMEERAVAKVLAQMRDKALAGRLSNLLKHTQEEG